MAIKLLSDLVTVVSEHISNPSTSGFEIFVGLEHYDAGEPVITRFGSTANLESSVKHFIEGDILVARRNVYLKRAGVVKFEGVTSGDSIVLRVKDECYKDIIPFILNTEEFWDYAEQNSDGTMSKRLAPDVLLEYECDIPDNHMDIAKKLWAAYELKEAYRKMIAATDEMVKSQFIEMFEFEDLSLLNPSDDFSVKCIDDTSSATKVPAGEYLGNGTYAIYDQSQDCEVAGYTDSHEGLCNNYPAVLFGDHSRVVKYINQPFFIGADGVKIIRPKNDDLLAEFLYYDLLYHNIPNTGYNRHFKYVKMLKLTEASVDRQKAFLGIAHQADKSKFELRQAIDKIDKVMKSLLQ